MRWVSVAFFGVVSLGRCFLAGAAGPSAPLRDRFVSKSGTRLVSESEPRLVSESEPRLVSGVEPPLRDRDAVQHSGIEELPAGETHRLRLDQA